MLASRLTKAASSTLKMGSIRFTPVITTRCFSDQPGDASDQIKSEKAKIGENVHPGQFKVDQITSNVDPETMLKKE